MKSTARPSGRGFSAPAHHPAPELLIDYASGASALAEMLLIDLHLAYCAGCRRSMAALLAAGGEMLDALPGERLPADLFDRTLGLLNGPEHPDNGVEAESVPAFAASWPRPLGRYLAHYGLKKWQKMPGGFHVVRVPLPDPDMRVLVMRAPGGRGPFPHDHARDEWTVVLEGGFTDESGTYNAGDFACVGPGTVHTVVSEPDAGCVCVLLIRAVPVYTTWLGRLLAPFIPV